MQKQEWKTNLRALVAGGRKGLLIYVLMFFCCVHISIEFVGEIEDDFLQIPLSGVKVSILNPDSTVVVDSAKTVDFRDRNGKLLKVMFSAVVKAEKRDYLLRATRPGYGDVWKPSFFLKIAP